MSKYQVASAVLWVFLFGFSFNLYRNRHYLFLSVCIHPRFTKTPWLLTNLKKKKKFSQDVIKSSEVKSSSPKRKDFPAKNKNACKRRRKN